MKTTKPARTKLVRVLRILARLQSGSLLIEVEERGPLSSKAAHYYVDPIPADFGRAFRFSKFECQGGEVHETNVGGEGEPAQCDCLGHQRWGHKTVCRHVAAVRALQARKVI